MSRELTNGFLIALSIGIYFFSMELLGLSHVFMLRLLNVFIVTYFVAKTIKANYKEGKNDYLDNIVSGALTSLIGVVISVAALLAYISFRGGNEYLAQLSQNFLFGGGTPSMYQYCIGLLFEGIASSVIITFTIMQYYKDRTYNQIFKH